ncbi:MAG: phosphotransferase [bacterium]|nr:phosphotransferase [bacterium]
MLTTVADLVPGAPHVHTSSEWADDVWFVDLVGGGRIVAKHQFYGLVTRGTPYDLLQVEYDVLRYLRAHGGAVPVVFGIAPGAQMILLEFVGCQTFADVLAGRFDTAIRRYLAGRALRELARIEARLADAEFAGDRRVIPGASIDDLAAAWAPVAAGAIDGLHRLWHRHCGDTPPNGLVDAIETLWQRLGARQPSLGATDYQPANIVVGDAHRRVTFLELSKLGWDWTERRAVQYTTSVDGSGMSLLDADVVGLCCLDSAALDGHLVIFQLLLAQRLLQSGDVDSRRLARELAVPLSADVDTLEVRRCLQLLTSC